MLHPRSPHNLHPTLLAIMGDYAIAQSSQQPPTAPPPSPSNPDPFTTYGVLAALLLSSGKVIIDIFKAYAGNVAKRSEIELKAQESEQQRNQDVAVMVMEQQKALVHHLQTSQAENNKQLMDLFRESNSSINKMSHAIEQLTEQLRKDGKP